MEYDETSGLRDAIKASPDNLPLRNLLVNALLRQKRHEEGEIEAKDALRIFPNDIQLKLALAECFSEQDKIKKSTRRKNKLRKSSIAQS